MAKDKKQAWGLSVCCFAKKMPQTRPDHAIAIGFDLKTGLSHAMEKSGGLCYTEGWNNFSKGTPIRRSGDDTIRF